MLAFLRSRPAVTAAVIYAVLSILLVGQGALPGRTLSGSDSLLSSVPWQSSRPASTPGLGTNFELADSANVFQPFLQFTRSQLPHIPLWNPYLMTGRPLLADGQSAVFSPFSAPSYVLPFWKSLAWVAALKLFVGALGTYLLARSLGMRFGGALLAGIVFAFGTFFVIWLAWPLTSVYAFIPWTLLLIERLVQRPEPLATCALALVVGLQFLGGHPESSFHLVFASAVFFVFRAALRWRSDHDRSRTLRALGAVVLGGIGGVLLAAVALVPFAEFLLHSGDFARRSHSASGYWPRKYIGALFLHDYWGRPTQADLEAFMQVRGWYAGAGSLMLGAAALIRRRTALRIGLVVFSLFCVCMIIGIPPVFGLVSRLPGFNAAHNERLLIYVLLSIALLAGFGLEDLSEARPAIPRPKRRAIIAAAAAIFALPVVWMLAAGTITGHELGRGLRVAWGFEHPPLPTTGFGLQGTATAAIVRDSALLIWLPLAAAAFVLIASRLRETRPLPVPVFVGLMALLIAADLFRANLGFNPAIPVRTAAPPTTGAIRYLQARRPNRFVGVSTEQLTQPLPADLAMRFGLYDARGYDFPVEKRFDELWRGSVAPNAGDFTQPEEFASATPAALRALNLLSVSDLMVGPLQAIKFPLRAPGLHIAYRGQDAVVYANSNALPRAFVVAGQQAVSGEQAALRAVTRPGFDGRRIAVTESPLPGLAQTPGSGGTAKIRALEPKRVTVSATSPHGGLLVLTDDYYPGWQATVDGHPAPTHRVDFVLRGVQLPPGSHTVAFTYRPASWRAAWIITVAVILGLLGTVAVTVLRNRRRPA